MKKYSILRRRDGHVLVRTTDATLAAKLWLRQRDPNQWMLNVEKVVESESEKLINQDIEGYTEFHERLDKEQMEIDAVQGDPRAVWGGYDEPDYE